MYRFILIFLSLIFLITLKYLLLTVINKMDDNVRDKFVKYSRADRVPFIIVEIYICLVLVILIIFWKENGFDKIFVVSLFIFFIISILFFIIYLSK